MQIGAGRVRSIRHLARNSSVASTNTKESSKPPSVDVVWFAVFEVRIVFVHSVGRGLSVFFAIQCGAVLVSSSSSLQAPVVGIGAGFVHETFSVCDLG